MVVPLTFSIKDHEVNMGIDIICLDQNGKAINKVPDSEGQFEKLLGSGKILGGNWLKF